MKATKTKPLKSNPPLSSDFMDIIQEWKGYVSFVPYSRNYHLSMSTQQVKNVIEE